MEDRHRRYLFETVDLVTLRLWYERLHYFRFLRTVGAHANDGDSLNAALRYEDEADLLGLLTALGLVPDTCVESQSEEGFASPRPSVIPGTSNLKQPGHCLIGGAEVFLWCSPSSLLISANLLSYTVKDIHVQAA